MKLSMLLLAAFSAVAALGAESAARAEYTWRGNGQGPYSVYSDSAYRSFADPGNWVDGWEWAMSPTLPVEPSAAYPGADDFLHLYSESTSTQYVQYPNYYIDLAATNEHPSNVYTIYGISGQTEERKYAHPWNNNRLYLRRGTLEILGTISNWNLWVYLRDGAKLKLAESSDSLLGHPSGYNQYDIASGCGLEIMGKVRIGCLRIDVKSGGSLIFDPKECAINPAAGAANNLYPSHIENKGTMMMTNGFHISGKSKNGDVLSFDLRQTAGTFVVGGDIVSEMDSGPARFVLNGGKIEVIGNAAVTGFDECVMSAGASAEIEIAAGKTLDLSEMVFGDNAELTVSGGGKIVFGPSAPDQLTLGDGVSVGYRLETGDAPAFRFVAGSTVDITGAEVDLSGTSGLEDVSVICIAFSPVGIGETVAIFPEGVLDAVENKITTRLPQGLTIESVGDRLRITKSFENEAVFSADGEVNITSGGNWSGGAAPSEGPVYVSGENTIAVVDSDVSALTEIHVIGGATLKLKGQIAALPVIRLHYNAKLQFAENAVVTLPKDSILAFANDGELPVVEVSAGAKVTIADDFGFKNVDLRLSGSVICEKNARFGTADAGELAWFAMTAEAGSIEGKGGGDSVISFIEPRADGGAVRVIGKIRFASPFRFIRPSSKWFLIRAGYLNPVSEPAEIEFDGASFDLNGNGYGYFGGALTLSFVNGAAFEKTVTSPGMYQRIFLEDQVKIVLDGGSRITFPWTQHSFQFTPDDSGFEQLTVKNSSYVAVDNFTGNGKAVAVFENGFWDVRQLPVGDENYDKGDRSIYGPDDVFSGLREVRVNAGSFVGIRGYNDKLPGEEWDRKVKIAKVPITGEGALFVTNAVSGRSLEVVMVAGNNTATGEAKAWQGEDGCHLLFADGSNWAGTLVGNGGIGFTNLVDAAGPAKVTLGAVRFEGDLAVRVWRGENATNDFIAVGGSLVAGEGRCGFKAVAADGGEIAKGESFIIGTYPKTAAAIAEGAFTARGWSLETVDPGEGLDYYLLKLTRSNARAAIFVR